MRISEIHKNGARIDVQGWFGVDKTVKAWRDHQDDLAASEEPEQGPKVTGVSGGSSGAVGRVYDSSNTFARTPVVKAEAMKFGFQPND